MSEYRNPKLEAELETMNDAEVYRRMLELQGQMEELMLQRRVLLELLQEKAPEATGRREREPSEPGS